MTFNRLWAGLTISKVTPLVIPGACMGGLPLPRGGGILAFDKARGVAAGVGEGGGDQARANRRAADRVEGCGGRAGGVGGYEQSVSGTQGLTETLSGGTWAPAAMTAQPGNTGQDPHLLAVTCLAPRSCTAIGDYTDTNGFGQGMIDTLSGRTWTAAQAPVPANAYPDPNALLNSVACPAVGSCLITGSFADASRNSPGLIESQNPPAPR